MPKEDSKTITAKTLAQMAEMIKGLQQKLEDQASDQPIKKCDAATQTSHSGSPTAETETQTEESSQALLSGFSALTVAKTINDLPHDLLAFIFSLLLQKEDIVSVSQVSRACRDAAAACVTSQILLAQRHYPSLWNDPRDHTISPLLSRSPYLTRFHPRKGVLVMSKGSGEIQYIGVGACGFAIKQVESVNYRDIISLTHLNNNSLIILTRDGIMLYTDITKTVAINPLKHQQDKITKIIRLRTNVAIALTQNGNLYQVTLHATNHSNSGAYHHADYRFDRIEHSKVESPIFIDYRIKFIHMEGPKQSGIMTMKGAAHPACYFFKISSTWEVATRKIEGLPSNLSAIVGYSLLHANDSHYTIELDIIHEKKIKRYQATFLIDSTEIITVAHQESIFVHTPWRATGYDCRNYVSVCEDESAPGQHMFVSTANVLGDSRNIAKGCLHTKSKAELLLTQKIHANAPKLEGKVPTAIQAELRKRFEWLKTQEGTHAECPQMLKLMAASL
jgi:hypothetical protein